MEVSSESALDNLPNEVLQEVVNNMSIDDLTYFCQTNRRMQKFCKDPAMWLSLAIKHYGVLNEEETKYFENGQNGKKAYIKTSLNKGYIYPGAEEFIPLEKALKKFLDDGEEIPEYFKNLYKNKVIEFVEAKTDHGDHELKNLLIVYYDEDILEEVLYKFGDAYLIEYLYNNNMINYNDIFEIIVQAAYEKRKDLATEILFSDFLVFTDQDIYEIASMGDYITVKMILEIYKENNTNPNSHTFNAMGAGLLAIDDIDGVKKMIQLGANPKTFMSYLDSDDDLSEEAKGFLKRYV